MTTNGSSVNVNQEIVVNPDMKNATPSHTARRWLRRRANNTSASSTNGIHGENR